MPLSKIYRRRIWLMHVQTSKGPATSDNNKTNRKLSRTRLLY